MATGNPNGEHELRRYPPEILNRAMRGEDPPRPILLLGAGASVKSGIPLAADLVAMAAKWGYCREHGRGVDDPSVLRSDWFPWLRRQPWFDENVPLPAQYPKAIEELLHPRETRRQFFLKELKPPGAPSAGYEALAKLIASRTIEHVLTVNFDDLIARACRADQKVTHLDVISSPDDLVTFSSAPAYPQVVHLHGAVERYEDRNLITETQELDSKLRDALLPLLRDHPLVVIGYRGAEPSVMHDLLSRSAAQHNEFRYGLYWCVLTDEQPGEMVESLAREIGKNFHLVEIDGFDAAMTRWADGIAPAPAPPVRASEPDVPDLRPEISSAVDDLDRRLLLSRLATYGRNLGLPSISDDDQTALGHRLQNQRLARATTDGLRLTRAAVLLFGRGTPTRVEIRQGRTTTPFAGNILTVLDQVIEAIAELNEPFRLKGPESQDVRRFDPRAVKELVVNALAHRDHDVDGPVRITVTERELTVVSPGGAPDGLPVDQLGQPGVKAYRNPVIADLLYGTGAMDKLGSGLPDVRKWTRQAGGEALFGPSPGGREFVASLRSRDIAPDPETGVADAGDVERFIVNAFPIEIVGDIHQFATRSRFRREVYDRQPRTSFPAFAIQPHRILTFEDPRAEDNPLSTEIRGDVDVVPVDDLIGAADEERLLVQLLNSTLLSWAHKHGLRSDARSLRMWFPRAEDGPREVTYRARVREATRTVTKVILTASGAVRFWEHEAIRFRFRRYGDTWLLHVVPTIVFTKDGESELLKGPKVGPLATKRMARDYNPQVQNDLYFWRWVLGEGEQENALDSGSVRLRAELLDRSVVDAPHALGAFQTDDPEPADDAEITEAIAAVAATVTDPDEVGDEEPEA
jgi:hypothetical protein